MSAIDRVEVQSRQFELRSCIVVVCCITVHANVINLMTTVKQVAICNVTARLCMLCFHQWDSTIHFNLSLVSGRTIGDVTATYVIIDAIIMKLCQSKHKCNSLFY